MRAPRSFNGDLRSLPYVPNKSVERAELPEPPLRPTRYQPVGVDLDALARSQEQPQLGPVVSAPAPAPIITFDGLDRFGWGAGSPPTPTEMWA